MRHRAPVDLLLRMLCAASLGLASALGEPRWHELPEGGRWTRLEMPPIGRPGFTLMPPEATGVGFTNTLSEAASAANRVLKNGSGLALGDFDGDGLVDLFLCGLEQPSRLYRNLGNWQFEEVTAQARLGIKVVWCSPPPGCVSSVNPICSTSMTAGEPSDPSRGPAARFATKRIVHCQTCRETGA
jgi:hypothetical protein